MATQAQASTSERRLTKDARAALARETVNKSIPAMLRAHPPAAAGVAAAVLHVNLPAPTAPLPATAPPSVRVVQADTLDAARALALAGTGRIGVLNMASVYTPGGGVLRGSCAQEEALCLRTTLYAALRPEWYRLPDLGVAHARDVLVFRASTERADELPKADRWFVDVLSCAAVRGPPVTDDRAGYADERDAELMRAKMVQVMRAAREAGIHRLVLGAFGCGAYENPPVEVARLWHAVLFGTRRRAREEFGVTEVVFAILAWDAVGRRNVETFRKQFQEDEVVIDV